MVLLISETRPTARKPHRCLNCGHDIPAGTRYLRQFLKDGGDTWDWVSHEDCMRAMWYLHEQDGGWYGDEAYPLWDYESATGEFPDHIRGLFPHVICRLEWWKQKR